MRGVINMAIKMLTLSIKNTSTLGRKKYGETMCNKPIRGCIIGKRKYSEGKIDGVVVSRHAQGLKKSSKENK